MLNYMRCQGGIDKLVHAFTTIWRAFEKAAAAVAAADAEAAAVAVAVADAAVDASEGDAAMSSSPFDFSDAATVVAAVAAAKLSMGGLGPPGPRKSLAVLTSALQIGVGLIEQLVNVGVLMGRGLHSSTFQLSLSLFGHTSPCTLSNRLAGDHAPNGP